MEKKNRDNLMPVMQRGTERFMEEMTEFVCFHAKNHSDQIFLLRNILLNVTGNLMKIASDTPQSLIEKADDYLKDFTNWKNVASKHFYEKGITKSFVNQKEFN